MAIAPSLQLRHSQHLVMTEQLQQSIKLLQLSSQELSAFIEQEVEKNPLLTSDDPSESTSPNDEEWQEESERVGEARDREESSMDMDDDDVWGGEQESSRYEGVAGGSRDGEPRGSLSETIEQSVSPAPTLKDHLMEQVQMDFSDPGRQLIAVHLIDLLDDGGYLREDTSHLATLLGTTEAEVEATIQQLQRCDPLGICARNLTECLEIQLRERGLMDETMQTLVRNIDLVATHDIRKLARAIGVEEDAVYALLDHVKRLDPRPGSHFHNEQVQTMIPDVVVRREKDGWRVDLNQDVLPKLLINRQYFTRLVGSSRKREEKKFLNEQLANANWLMKALDQRAQTLMKVSIEIVKQQEGFLDYGIHHLKPMTLKHIAEKAGVHESTVSRITTGKFMATPRGVYDMKYFFSSGLSDAVTGEGTSSRTVMHMIKELIGREKPDGILSDDAIATTLQQRGIDVARRTVVKYRTIMHIPSSVERRRAKRRELQLL